MKKIVSLLSAFAMICTMLSTVAFADASNELVLTPKNKTANSVDLDVSVTTTYEDLQTITVYFDMSDALTKGATVKVANADATLSFNNAQKMVALSFAPTDAHKYVSGTVLGTISLTNISDNFNIKLKPSTGRMTTKITSTGSGTVTNEIVDPATFSNSVTMQDKPKFTPAAGGEQYGQKTYIPGIISVDLSKAADAKVKITDEANVSKEVALADYVPALSGEGSINLLAIVRYAGETDKTFTVEVVE